MWKLHRYYLKELVINAAITFTVLFAVVLVSLIARGIQKAQGGNLLDAALITLLWAVDAGPHLLTIAFLIAVVLTFTRAAQDRELLAIRAAGISPRLPMQAPLLVGIALSVVCSVAMHYLIPEVHYRKFRVISEVARSMFQNLNLGSDHIKFGDSGQIMTFRDRDDQEFRDCTLYGPPEKPLPGFQSSIVRVDRIWIQKPKDSDKDLAVVLDGVRDPIGRGTPSRITFVVPMSDLAAGARRDNRDDDMNSDQLLAEVLRDVHQRPHEALYTLFRRCCFGLMPALMAPIGFCIAELARERGRVVALVFALVPLCLFYLGEVLGARLLIPTQSPWCGWLPAALLLTFGVPFCWRQLRR